MQLEILPHFSLCSHTTLHISLILLVIIQAYGLPCIQLLTEQHKPIIIASCMQSSLTTNYMVNKCYLILMWANEFIIQLQCHTCQPSRVSLDCPGIWTFVRDLVHLSRDFGIFYFSLCTVLYFFSLQPVMKPNINFYSHFSLHNY